MAQFQPSFPTSFSQRTPCMLVLDASGSMAARINGGERTRIDELNNGLKLLKNELCEDETASVRVQLAIVSVGGPEHRAELIMDWTDATEFDPPVMEADGPTPLGQGMRLALHHVDRHKANLNQFGIPYTRPWIMVISDGEPSDRGNVWKAITEECRAAEAAKRCVIFPIGVEDGNLDILQELSNTRAARLSSTNFGKYFQWLSASLSCVSRSQGMDSVALPATDPWAYFR